MPKKSSSPSSSISKPRSLPPEMVMICVVGTTPVIVGVLELLHNEGPIFLYKRATCISVSEQDLALLRLDTTPEIMRETPPSSKSTLTKQSWIKELSETLSRFGRTQKNSSPNS